MFREATEIARSFYLNYINEIPVDLKQLCNDFGWILRKDKLNGEDGYLIVMNGSHKKYIYYDDSPAYINSNRYRFTIAHEIGHIILKHYKLDQNRLSHNEIYMMEKQADIVAAEILMPYKELIKLSDYDIPCLCEYFKVSKEAMTVRLETLGLNKNMGRDYSFGLSY